MASKSNAGSTAPIYEDFQPKSEEKEEQEAHFLYIHLPDFSKEQIRVSYIHATRTIRVQGERPLENNKGSRFTWTFLVPENCSVDKIQGWFQEGILTITIPKQTIAPPQPTAAPKQEGTKITPRKREPSSALAPPPQEPSSVTAPPPKVPSPVAAPPPKEPSPAAAPPPKVPSPVAAPPPKELSPVAAPPKVPSPVAAPPPKQPSPVAALPPKELSPVAAPPKVPSPVAAPPPKQPSPVPAPPPPPSPPKAHSSVAVPPSKPVAPVQLPQGEIIGKDQESSLAFQTPQKPITEPKAQNYQEQGDTSAKATPKQRTVKEDSVKKGDVVGEKDKVKEETSFIEKATKMKNVAMAMMKTALEKKEDRHLIVNVGVAVCVIVAVGAYVTYKIRSSAKA